jgi:hypothetical protein
MIMRIAKFALPEIRDGEYINSEAIQSWAEGIAAGFE